MNLIEQLGGYEKAKEWYKDQDLRGNHTVRIRHALLEHRRQHNIFEVGDFVVYSGEAGLSGLFQIETLTKTGKPRTVKTERFGNFPCRYCEVQHATDEEVKAGRRL